MKENETFVAQEIQPIDVKLVFLEDGDHLFDNGVDLGIPPVSKDGLAYELPKNSANRFFFNLHKLSKIKETGATETVLEYRASRKLGPIGNKLPNEKLISYLPEAEQAEYKAIIERAMKAREDAKAKPMTELEKAKAKLEKAKAALAKLEEQAANGNI